MFRIISDIIFGGLGTFLIICGIIRLDVGVIIIGLLSFLAMGLLQHLD